MILSPKGAQLKECRISVRQRAVLKERCSINVSGWDPGNKQKSESLHISYYKRFRNHQYRKTSSLRFFQGTDKTVIETGDWRSASVVAKKFFLRIPGLTFLIVKLGIHSQALKQCFQRGQNSDTLQVWCYFSKCDSFPPNIAQIDGK